jgi:hypothetical protein
VVTDLGGNKLHVIGTGAPGKATARSRSPSSTTRRGWRCAATRCTSPTARTT